MNPEDADGRAGFPVPPRATLAPQPDPHPPAKPPLAPDTFDRDFKQLEADIAEGV